MPDMKCKLLYIGKGSAMRLILIVLFILSMLLKSLAESPNSTIDEQVPGTRDSYKCDNTLDERAMNYVDIFPGNLTNSNFDLEQFNYNLEVVYSIGKDSWYDYIVIGAGVGGSVVASRLSEDPSVRVLLLEAGGNEDWYDNIPGVWTTLQKTWRDYAYSSLPQGKCCKQHVNNQVPIPRGKIIGGTSVLNGVVYQHGSPEDFDRWDRIYGARGWSFRDVFPYFIKSESVKLSKRLDLGYHGTEGIYPVQVENLDKIKTTVIDAIAELGYPIGDVNGRDPVRSDSTQHGIRQGLRQSTARAFLSRASSRPNLDIHVFARADRILFEGSSNKAIGVEYTANSMKNRVFARREIIVSAGVIDTPKLLMLSGLGPADDLKSLGIPVLVDLPGVGKNLHDQPGLTLPFATLPDETASNLLQSLNEYITRREGLFSTISAVWGFFRSKFAKDTRPDCELLFNSGLYGGLEPFDQTAWRLNWRTEVKERYYGPYEGKSGFQILPAVVHPFSRGWIKLASKDPDQAPLINYNYLDDERDIDVLVEGCKLAQRITQTRAMSPLKPRFLGVVEQCRDLPLFSDEYLRCVIPILTTSYYHPVGTAKMGPPSDKFAVIDSELRVYGVDGLRVADASVMPETISGHPMGTIIMIGERCSDFIKGRHLKPTLPPIENEREILTYH